MKLSFLKETVTIGTKPISNYCLLETVTPPLSNWMQPNIDLVLVIDLSLTGIAKNMVKILRKAVEQTVNALKPEDRICLVAFGSKAVEVFALSKIKSKKQIKDKIKQISYIDVGPTTVIFSGMQAAYNTLVQSFGSNLKRIILLTGGESTEPEYKCKDLGKFFNKHGIQMRCIGVGGKWNMHLLDELDWKHDPVYIPYDEIDLIPERIVQEYEDMSNTYATDVILQFNLVEGMEIKKFTRFYPHICRVEHESGTYNFKLGSLVANSKECFLFQILLPPRTYEVIYTLGKYKLIYRDPLTGSKNETPLRSIRVSYSRNEALIRNINPEMLAYVKQQSIHALVEKALNRTKAGNISLGIKLLGNAAQLAKGLEKTELESLFGEILESVKNSRGLSAEQQKALYYSTIKTDLLNAEY